MNNPRTLTALFLENRLSAHLLEVHPDKQEDFLSGVDWVYPAEQVAFTLALCTVFGIQPQQPLPSTWTDERLVKAADISTDLPGDLRLGSTAEEALDTLIYGEPRAAGPTLSEFRQAAFDHLKAVLPQRELNPLTWQKTTAFGVVEVQAYGRGCRLIPSDAGTSSRALPVEQDLTLPDRIHRARLHLHAAGFVVTQDTVVMTEDPRGGYAPLLSRVVQEVLVTRHQVTSSFATPDLLVEALDRLDDFDRLALMGWVGAETGTPAGDPRMVYEAVRTALAHRRSFFEVLAEVGSPLPF